MSFSKLKPYIETALNWMWSEDKQPDDAVLFHLGISLDGDVHERVYVSLCPRGYQSGPVLVFNLHEKYKQYETVGSVRKLINPFTSQEVEELLQLVSSITEISEHWNGKGCDTFSIGLVKYASREISRVLGNYSAGCQGCASDRHYNGNVFCPGWLSEKADKLKTPENWG